MRNCACKLKSKKEADIYGNQTVSMLYKINLRPPSFENKKFGIKFQVEGGFLRHCFIQFILKVLFRVEKSRKFRPPCSHDFLRADVLMLAFFFSIVSILFNSFIYYYSFLIFSQ